MAVAGSTETVVVGGGIAGTSIAAHLADRGEDVVLLEKDALASGSTGRSAGVVETQYLSEFDVAIRARALRAFEALAAETRAEFHQIGYVRLLMDPDEEDAFRESVRIQDRHGVADARFLEPDELAELVPDLSVDDVHGALFGPSDGYADPHTITRIFAERARQRGADVRTGVEATGVRTRGRDVEAVETTAGRIECDRVVNAAGPWAPRFAESVDLDLPAAPYRRQVLVAEPGEGTRPGYTVPMVMEYTPAGTEPGLYFRAEGDDGRVMMGLHREVTADEPTADPGAYQTAHDADFPLEVFELLDRRAPAFADFSVTNGWSGLYTITPDAEPIIDRHPEVPEYYVAAGFSGKGFQIGPTVGEIVADLITDGRTGVVPDLSPVRLDRFGR